ncbi:MAG: DUF2179 domain-containing protein [Lachnospirales bacterium]
MEFADWNYDPGLKYTVWKAKGSYTGEDRDVLFCACSKTQTYMVRHAAYEIDDSAFIMVTEPKEVFGEGFSKHTFRQKHKGGIKTVKTKKRTDE